MPTEQDPLALAVLLDHGTGIAALPFLPPPSTRTSCLNAATNKKKVITSKHLAGMTVVWPGPMAAYYSN